jgi:hypothetical protein
MSVLHKIQEFEQSLAAKGAKAPLNGRYNLRNVGSGLFADVQGDGVAPGTNIIAFKLNTPPSSNQQWDFVRQSHDGFTFTLQVALNNFFPLPEEIAEGSKLVTTPKPVVWQLIPVDGFYKISIFRQPAGSDLVLAQARPGVTPNNNLVLEQNTENIIAFQLNTPASSNQQWDFVRQSHDGFTFTLQVALNNYFPLPEEIAEGSKLVTTPKPVVWQLIPVDGFFKISIFRQPAGSDLVLAQARPGVTPSNNLVLEQTRRTSTASSGSSSYSRTRTPIGLE